MSNVRFPVSTVKQLLALENEVDFPFRLDVEAVNSDANTRSFGVTVSKDRAVKIFVKNTFGSLTDKVNGQQQERVLNALKGFTSRVISNQTVKVGTLVNVEKDRISSDSLNSKAWLLGAQRPCMKDTEPLTLVVDFDEVITSTESTSTFKEAHSINQTGFLGQKVIHMSPARMAQLRYLQNKGHEIKVLTENKFIYQELKELFSSYGIYLKKENVISTMPETPMELDKFYEQTIKPNIDKIDFVEQQRWGETHLFLSNQVVMKSRGYEKSAQNGYQLKTVNSHFIGERVSFPNFG
ncbi:hypothetical protein JQC92_12185 [Shewanella sp. 202IG2-18]|uniref:hypothetical protein n=1 Tax=Parashewanella hymeniacidonis TaxID=2807618 RepID=UPI001960544F|nr:hypothetical protein [Parashewanella hymeniacidonis]MBM7072782.1 hypothetical protein [Parashewanella hymeniacidonis]